MTQSAVGAGHPTFTISVRDGCLPAPSPGALQRPFKVIETGLLLVIVSVAMVVGVQAPVRGDVVKLRGGGVLEGEVSKRGDCLVVLIREGMEVVVDLEEVLEVLRKPNPKRLLEQRRQQLKPYDVGGLYDLSLEAFEQGLKSEGRGLLEQVLEINANHPEARALLGYVRVDEGWMSRHEAMYLSGKVRYRGQWMDAGERDARQRRARERDLERQCRSLLRRYQRAASELSQQRVRKELADLAPDPHAGQLLSTLLVTEAHWQPRLLVAGALRLWKTEASAQVLTEVALSDDVQAVRRACVDSLRLRRNQASANRFLGVFVKSRNSERRQRAAQALGILRAKSSVESLIVALYVRSSTRRTVPVRGQQRGDSDQYFFGLVARESRRVTDYRFDSLARDTLMAVTGRNFDYAKSDWLAWWQETRDSLDDFMQELPVDVEAPSSQNQ